MCGFYKMSEKKEGEKMVEKSHFSFILRFFPIISTLSTLEKATNTSPMWSPEALIYKGFLGISTVSTPNLKSFQNVVKCGVLIKVWKFAF